MTVFAGILVTVFSAWIITVIILLARSFRTHPLLPDRWERGAARWWGRCWRWTRRLRAPHEDVKVRIPAAHAPTLSGVWHVRRGEVVVNALRLSNEIGKER